MFVLDDDTTINTMNWIPNKSGCDCETYRNFDRLAQWTNGIMVDDNSYYHDNNYFHTSSARCYDIPSGATSDASSIASVAVGQGTRFSDYYGQYFLVAQIETYKFATVSCNSGQVIYNNQCYDSCAQTHTSVASLFTYSGQCFTSCSSAGVVQYG